MTRMIIDDAIITAWLNSKDAKARRVRSDIVRGFFKCRNFGFSNDYDYLTNPKIIKESVARCGYKLKDILEVLQ